MTWMFSADRLRSGFLDVVFSAALTSLLLLPSSSRGRIIGVAIALAAGCCISLALPSLLGVARNDLGRVRPDDKRGRGFAQESGENHLAVLIQSLQYTFEHPVFGWAWGIIIANGTDLGCQRMVGTHNTFTEVSSERASRALLLFVGLLVTAFAQHQEKQQNFGQQSGRRELNLIARLQKSAFCRLHLELFFCHLAYEYYFFYLVGLVSGFNKSLDDTGQISRW